MTLLALANIAYPLLALCAMVLVAHKKKSAFIIFLFVEVIMLYIGIVSEQYGVALMAVLYFFANIYTYIKWAKDDRKHKTYRSGC